MISAVLLQATFDSTGVLKILAIGGGALVGGVAVDLLARLLAFTLMAAKLRGKPLHGLRLGGAGVGGWLVALWVFGGGGSGLGGGGGFGVGPGSGTGADDSPAATKDAGAEVQKAVPPGATGGESLRVEVLGKSPLARITKNTSPDLERCYRIEGSEGPQLLTLPEVKELVRQREKQTPPLRRLEIVLYNDSPARDVPFVARLSQWARDQAGSDSEKIKVDFSAPDANAPLP